MKKTKYIAVTLIVIMGLLLSLVIYKSYIYYMIPFNPIKEYSTESVKFQITKNLPDGSSEVTECEDANTCSSVLKYLSNLKLKPLKNKVADKNISLESKTYFNGVIELKGSRLILISDVSLDTPTIIRLSSTSITGFKNGYYEIVDSEFDYSYIHNLISNESKK